MEWYYEQNGKRRGPVDATDFGALCRSGVIQSTTLVWCNLYEDWKPAGEAAELASVFAPTLPAASDTPAPPDASTREIPLQFTGTAGEYFRIWIVNVGLTILTLGIYAAWAKVRKQRYFHEHTLLDGHPFEYTGSPISILKGKLILGVFFIAINVLPIFLPPSIPVLLILFAVGYPWVVTTGLRFQAHHTRHRGVRFGFGGTLAESYRINLFVGLLATLTFGLLAPFLLFRRNQYRYGNLTFGNAKFSYAGTFPQFFRLAISASAIAVGGIIIATLLTFPIVIQFDSVRLIQARGDSMYEFLRATALLTIVFLAGTSIAFAVAQQFYFVATTNYSLGKTKIGTVAELRGTMRFGEVLAMEAVNILAIIASLGLLIPWASIRRARYRSAHCVVTLRGDPASLVHAVQATAPTQPILGEVGY